MLQRVTVIRALLVCLLAGFPAAACFAETYYVRNGGSDGSSGKSHDNAFRSVSFAFDMLRDGDSLFLQSGGIWKPLGSVNLRRDDVTIGAYHVDSSGAVILGVSGSRPVIDGQTIVPRRGSYSGLIHVTGTNSIIRDLEVNNSGGTGIRFYETSGGLVENVKTDWAYFYGIQAYRTENIEIRNCEVIGFGRGGREFGERTFPNGISLRTTNNILVAGNIVREGWGEGINSFFGSSNIIIENNLVYAVRNVGIYVDSTRNATVRNNVVLGTTQSDYHRYGSNTFVGPGLALNNEDYQFQDFGGSLTLSDMARDVKMYNNLVAGTAIGLAIWGQHPDSSIRDVQIAHNTFVDNDVQLNVSLANTSGIEIANNVFMTVSNSGEDYKGASSADSIRFINNFWSQGEPDSRLRSQGDIYSGLVLSKMNGWRGVSSHLQVDWQDFVPQSGSGTIGAASQEIAVSIAGDHNGTRLNSPPDIGALANGTTGIAGVSPPMSPFLKPIN